MLEPKGALSVNVSGAISSLLGEQPWPPSIQKFIFEVDGVYLGTFTSVSGLSAEVEVEPIREGGNNSFVHKLPKGFTYPNLTLKRGMVRLNSLWMWLEGSSGSGLAVKNNMLVRAVCGLTMLNTKGVRSRTWMITGAFPVKWTGPDFNATAQEAATESLEIAHEGLYALPL